jgi:hypothetical protein
VREEARS